MAILLFLLGGIGWGPASVYILPHFRAGRFPLAKHFDATIPLGSKTGKRARTPRKALELAEFCSDIIAPWVKTTFLDTVTGRELEFGAGNRMEGGQVDFGVSLEMKATNNNFTNSATLTASRRQRENSRICRTSLLALTWSAWPRNPTHCWEEVESMVYCFWLLGGGKMGATWSGGPRAVWILGKGETGRSVFHRGGSTVQYEV